MRPVANLEHVGRTRDDEHVSGQLRLDVPVGEDRTDGARQPQRGFGQQRADLVEEHDDANTRGGPCASLEERLEFVGLLRKTDLRAAVAHRQLCGDLRRDVLDALGHLRARYGFEIDEHEGVLLTQQMAQFEQQARLPGLTGPHHGADAAHAREPGLHLVQFGGAPDEQRALGVDRSLRHEHCFRTSAGRNSSCAAATPLSRTIRGYWDMPNR